MSECLFDRIIAGEVPAHIVLDDDVAMGFLDRRPVFKGHVLVVPRQHFETLADLPEDLVGPLFNRVRRVSAVMPSALGSTGSLVLANNIVSQSVPHLHVHVIPRTKGDGLRGFLWPRHTYADDEEADQYAARIRSALDSTTGQVVHGRL
ncbi:MAG TPA: HIT family protein [Streptosporangiaceae bacterium]|nr:HIT family protein [Streptosporangiaceae bacterium]